MPIVPTAVQEWMVMAMREKLAELIEECSIPVRAASGRIMAHYAVYGDEAKHLADHLIANGVTLQKWIPVTERLPEKESTVLVYRADEGIELCKYYPRLTVEIGDWDNVTHWMPLPEAPEGG